jgi:hypothetical protein
MVFSLGPGVELVGCKRSSFVVCRRHIFQDKLIITVHQIAENGIISSSQAIEFWPSIPPSASLLQLSEGDQIAYYATA